MVREVVSRLGRSGIEVVVEAGGGGGAGIPDELQTEPGQPSAIRGTRTSSPRSRRRTQEEVGRLKHGSVFIGFLQPLTDPEIAEALDSRTSRDAFNGRSCRNLPAWLLSTAP
jgi:NAD(P) transhydrogenase subunit alpha